MERRNRVPDVTAIADQLIKDYRAVGEATPKRCHSPGTPLSS
jgi:hypothetical protein